MTVPSNCFAGDGFCNWKHAADRVVQHESSKNHLESIVNFSKRSNAIASVDRKLEVQIKEATAYWKQILQRAVSTIKFLAERGLAFRGSDEQISSAHNGNYLGILELIAQYDPFLAKHIKDHANKGSGHVNYLSKTICEQLIDVMAKEVLGQVCARIKKAKYFSVSVDSSPDEGHIDQLTVVVRYIEGIRPEERFLTLIPNCGHTGREMANALVKLLKDLGIDIEDCRGQSYDNAPNMSGKYEGMQALISKLNHHAVFFPCCGHSLSLAGQTATSICAAATDFFTFLQKLYNFFTGSSARYHILNEKFEKSSSTNQTYTLKSLSNTRWSCNYEAVRALVFGYNEIENALKEISTNDEEKAIVKCEASGLLRIMARLETAIYSVIWYDILGRFDAVSKYLQSPTMVLGTAVKSLKSLKSYIESKRNSFEEYETRGRRLTGTREYDSNLRVRKSNTMPSRDKFRIEAFLPVVDSLTMELSKRLSAYEAAYERFGFLSDLMTITSEELNIKAENLVQCYPKDLEYSLSAELSHLSELFKLYTQLDCESVELFLYRIIIENNLRSTFVNAEIVLRMYLSMMVTNCSGERSFSKMKLIKNRLRTNMGQERLNNLMILSIESDILRELSFDNIIDDFASKKSRKVTLS